MSNIVWCTCILVIALCSIKNNSLHTVRLPDVVMPVGTGLVDGKGDMLASIDVSCYEIHRI